MAKELRTRIQHKYDSRENWNEATFAPKAGELIIYSDGKDQSSSGPALKVGDGVKLPKDLPWIAGSGEGGSSSEELPVATTTEYGITKLSTAVDSDATDVAATPSAVKRAYDLAASGGKYGQHCWLVENYATVEPSSVETKLTQDVTLCTATIGMSYDLKYSTEMSGGALVSPTTVKLVSTSFYNSNTEATAYAYAINNSFDDFNTLVNTTLRNLSKTSNGVYIQIGDGDIYRVYNDTDSMYVNLFAYDTIVINNGSSIYYTSFKIKGGSVVDPSNGTNFDAKTYKIFTSPGYTKVVNSSIVYSVRKEDFTEGDDGNGHIYTYLNIPADTLPLESKFTQHCWRKQGYKFEIGGNENISYTPVYEESGIVGGYTENDYTVRGTKFGMANSITLTDDGKWIPDSASVKYAEVGRFGTYYQTKDQAYTDEMHLYYGFNILGYYWGVAPGFSSPLEWVTDTTFSQYLSQRLSENGGEVYISLDATSKDDWTGSKIYRITNSSQLSLGSNTFNTGDSSMDPDSSTVTYYSIYFRGAQLCSETPESDKDYDSTYDGVDEIIYTPVENAFTPGDNGQGLKYTYYGIPAYSWFTNKTGSTSSSTPSNMAKIQTGEYIGSGTYGSYNGGNPTGTNTLTFSFTPKYVFVSGVIQSSAGSDASYNSVVFDISALASSFSDIHRAGVGSGSFAGGGSSQIAIFKNNTLTWYYHDAATQLNYSGITYHWVAIG